MIFLFFRYLLATYTLYTITHHEKKLTCYLFLTPCLLVFRIAGGKLEKIGETIVDAGAGPRHMVLHPTRYTAAGGGEVDLKTCNFNDIFASHRPYRNICKTCFSQYSINLILFFIPGDWGHISAKIGLISRSENLSQNQPSALVILKSNIIP
jgi:hypothetical protein